MSLLPQINLASEPFRKDRPMVVASATVGALLLILLGLLSGIAVSQRGELAETRQLIARLEGQIRTLAAQQAQLDAGLRRPENAEVLELSLFLNALLQRKAIAWTRIFSDLESVLPHDVRLIQVRLPQINAANEVQLDMTVGAQSSEPVLQFLMRLEGSPQFGATAVNNWLPPSQTEPLFRYRVSVSYAQKL